MTDEDVKELYVLAPVDEILENIGLPRTKPLLDAVSPKTVFGDKLGLTSPGEVLEETLDEVTSGMRPGKLPELPGLGR